MSVGIGEAKTNSEVKIIFIVLGPLTQMLGACLA